MTYDLPVDYADYSGYYLKNGSGVITKVISSTPGPVSGYTTVITEDDIGTYDVSFVLFANPDIQRVIDYKLQADSKNFYYFSDQNEWVIYHTFDQTSYYGNRFYPTIGAIVCYDENDEEINPTEIIFYPECMGDGVFEGAKTIIQWASKQSGKVCFNAGFSNEEGNDQSRFIIPVSRYGWSQVGGEVNTTVTIPRTYRSTAINIIEPFMTIDAVEPIGLPPLIL